MITKTCIKCGKLKELDQFVTQKDMPNGKRNECRLCDKLRLQIMYRKNRTEHLRKAKEYYATHKEILKPRLYELKKRNPEKIIARSKLNHFIEGGHVARGECGVCKKLHDLTKQGDAHHSDYSKPLDVIWLCRRHHMAWHRLFLAENA